MAVHKSVINNYTLVIKHDLHRSYSNDYAHIIRCFSGVKCYIYFFVDTSGPISGFSGGDMTSVGPISGLTGGDMASPGPLNGLMGGLTSFLGPDLFGMGGTPGSMSGAGLFGSGSEGGLLGGLGLGGGLFGGMGGVNTGRGSGPSNGFASRSNRQADMMRTMLLLQMMGGADAPDPPPTQPGRAGPRGGMRRGPPTPMEQLMRLEQIEMIRQQQIERAMRNRMLPENQRGSDKSRFPPNQGPFGPSEGPYGPNQRTFGPEPRGRYPPGDHRGGFNQGSNGRYRADQGPNLPEQRGKFPQDQGPYAQPDTQGQGSNPPNRGSIPFWGDRQGRSFRDRQQNHPAPIERSATTAAPSAQSQGEPVEREPAQAGNQGQNPRPEAAASGSVQGSRLDMTGTGRGWPQRGQELFGTRNRYQPTGRQPTFDSAFPPRQFSPQAPPTRSQQLMRERGRSNVPRNIQELMADPRFQRRLRLNTRPSPAANSADVRADQADRMADYMDNLQAINPIQRLMMGSGMGMGMMGGAMEMGVPGMGMPGLGMGVPGMGMSGLGGDLMGLGGLLGLGSAGAPGIGSRGSVGGADSPGLVRGGASGLTGPEVGGTGRELGGPVQEAGVPNSRTV